MVLKFDTMAGTTNRFGTSILPILLGVNSVVNMRVLLSLVESSAGVSARAGGRFLVPTPCVSLRVARVYTARREGTKRFSPFRVRLCCTACAPIPGPGLAALMRLRGSPLRP